MRRVALGAGKGTAAALLVVAAFCSGSAWGAGPPIVGAVWSSEVRATSGGLNSEVMPNGEFSRYRFEYVSDAVYQGNLAAGQDGFVGATALPPPPGVPLGAGNTPIRVSQVASPLQPGTSYRYRIVASNPVGIVASAAHLFRTFDLPSSPEPCPNQELRNMKAEARLPDCRAYEMVSPVEKNGGQVDPPESIRGGGVLQGAADGGAASFSSTASFGDASGAPPGSQYVSRRTSNGWWTENLSTPLLSGSYGFEPDGVPFQLFSEDLARSLLLSGSGCRGGGTDCASANPPLPGSGAPAGYQNYYIREGGAFAALVGGANVVNTAVNAARFQLSFAGATPDLRHVALSSCAALTFDATEVPQSEGCDATMPNLYLWSHHGLILLNRLPGETVGTPGAALASPSGAISRDGSRVYWRSLGNGNLYLRDGAQTQQVDAAAGGGGTFETASADGGVAFFTKEGHLHRFLAATQASADLTPGGGVAGVLGASEDGSVVYYLADDGLFVWRSGAVSMVAASADASNGPPATGTARVSGDGTRLVFVASEPLTGYDNTDVATGEADSQVYLYDATGSGLECLSCNPANQRPSGPSSVPGAVRNGSGPSGGALYKPRVLTAAGRRVLFESADALVPEDSNGALDVYQWEAAGTGSCSRAGGCLSLISTGEAEGGATFVDASASGADAFFRTGQSLAGADPGSVDLYDARIGGGFPEPVEPIPCTGDSCQLIPAEPSDPTLGTTVPGRGNPAVSYSTRKRKRCMRQRRRGGRRQNARACRRKPRAGRKAVNRKAGKRRARDRRRVDKGRGGGR